MREPKWGALERTIKRLLKERGLSMKALENQHVAAAGTTRKLWNEGVPRGTLEKIARALEVDPDDIAFKVTDPVDPMNFYPAIGLKADPPAKLPDNGCYQDWSEDGDDQAIEYLWAEAEGSWIKAEVLPKKERWDEEDPTKEECDKEDRRFLRVSFSNAVGTYASNLAIHPQGMRAVAADDKRYIVFQARLADTDLGRREGETQEVRHRNRRTCSRREAPTVGIQAEVRSSHTGKYHREGSGMATIPRGFESRLWDVAESGHGPVTQRGDGRLQRDYEHSV